MSNKLPASMKKKVSIKVPYSAIKKSPRVIKKVNIFQDEDTIFAETLNKHRHDKSFFMTIAKKAGIYDASGNLESSYKRQ